VFAASEGTKVGVINTTAAVFGTDEGRPDFQSLSNNQPKERRRNINRTGFDVTLMPLAAVYFTISGAAFCRIRCEIWN
jgi:hypothetical protein